MKNDNKEPLSAEEYFRNRFKEKFSEPITLWKRNIDGETAMRWAHEFMTLRTKHLTAELESLKKEREWIPVSERLPEFHPGMKTATVDVLFFADGEYHAGWYSYSAKRWFVETMNGSVPIDNVTHWSILPSPPNQ